VLTKPRARPLALVAIGLSALLMVAGCGTPREVDTFYFQMTGLTTDRQGGATVDIIVALRYADGTAIEQIPDYRPIADKAEGFLEPSDALPASISWEALLRTMVPSIMESGPMSGVSIGLRVYPTCDGKPDTDLVRMAVYTEGDIDPLPYSESSDVKCQTVNGS
jgi:hypothetical protein